MSDVVEDITFANSTDSTVKADVNDTPKIDSTAGGDGTSVDKAENSRGRDDIFSDGPHADSQVTFEKIASMFKEATSW